MKVRAPIYLLRSTEHCWKCKREQDVFALGSADIEHEGAEKEISPAESPEFALLSDIEAMPAEILALIHKRTRRYEKHYSKTAECAYYANFCECGANYGDFYLFSEPDGAFFPMSDEVAGKIRYQALPIDGEFEFECSVHYGVAQTIFECARTELALEQN